MKERIKTIQNKLNVTADGIIGPVTLSAIEDALGIQPNVEVASMPTQAQVRSGKSVFGAPGVESNLVNITPAYQLYYEGTPVQTIRVHKCIADRVARVFQRVLEAYGSEKIRALGLDQYSGSYNYRSTSSGSSLSMHAWGIALDFDAEHNTYSMHRPDARLSGAEYETWWTIWEEEGGVSLGRERDYDWMHVQFATL